MRKERGWIIRALVVDDDVHEGGHLIEVPPFPFDLIAPERLP